MSKYYFVGAVLIVMSYWFGYKRGQYEMSIKRGDYSPFTGWSDVGKSIEYQGSTSSN